MKSNKPILLLCFALIVFSFLSCEECEECTNAAYLNEPANIISVTKAKEMYDIYTDRRVVPIMKFEEETGGVPFNPTRYVEFDIEEILHYLTYIESEADLANVSIETLRIYLGAYPEAGDFDNGEVAQYNKQSTVFMLPTTQHNGENLGFYTSGQQGSDLRYPVYLKNIEPDLKNINGKRNANTLQASMIPSFAIQDSIVDDRSLILNDGNVVPPPKSKTDMGGSGDKPENEDPPSDEDPKNDTTKIDPKISEKQKIEEIKRQEIREVNSKKQ